jgi:hypothetical protein
MEGRGEERAAGWNRTAGCGAMIWCLNGRRNLEVRI